MKYLVLIADIDEFNPCKNSLGDLVKKEYKIKHMPTTTISSDIFKKKARISCS